jgi:hypothetical protein
MPSKVKSSVHSLSAHPPNCNKVCLIWFIFHVLQLLYIRLTKTKLVLHRQIYDEASTKTELKVEHSLTLVMVIKSSSWLIPQLNSYVLLNVSTIEYGVCNEIERRSPLFI